MLPLGIKLIIFILRLLFQEPGVIFLKRIMMKILVLGKKEFKRAHLWQKDIYNFFFLRLGSRRGFQDG
jgi:hypothetical protein